MRPMSEIVPGRAARGAHSFVARTVTWLRLGFALQRWELLLLAAATALFTGLMLWIAWQANVLVSIDPSCFPAESAVGGVAQPLPAGGESAAAASAVCQRLSAQFSEVYNWGTQLLMVAFGVPFGMGLLLGVPLVAREVDHGTAGVTWPLSRSRVRWLAWRIGFVALAVIGLMLVISVASEVMARAIQPHSDLGASFIWYGQRGPLLIVRGLLALAIGLAVGAMIGRQLPALLAAIFVAAAIFTGVSLVMDRWLEADALTAPYGDYTGLERARQLGERVTLDSGEEVSFIELTRRDYQTVAIGDDGTIYTAIDEASGTPSHPIGRMVSLFIPGERYVEVMLSESAVLAGLVLLVGGLALVVVQRRRPS